MTQEHDLYRKHRPKTFNEIVGQDSVVKVLRQKIKQGQLPHAIMLTGPSGCGKTTIARILKDKLGCHDNDYFEVDLASSKNPKETVREIQNAMGLSAGAGSCRVYLLEEVQSLSRSTYAQQALLIMLENPPDHCYFFLATTDPSKIHRAVHTRCFPIHLKSLSDQDMEKVVLNVLEKEKVKPPSRKVMDSLIESAGGSPRQVLRTLDKIIGLESEEDQLAEILPPEADRQAYDIVKALLWEKSTWAKVASILKEVKDEPETLRNRILGIANGELLKANSRTAVRAFAIILAFENDFIRGGKASLSRACWDVISTVHS